MATSPPSARCDEGVPVDTLRQQSPQEKKTIDEERRYCYENRSVGVWWKQPNKQDNGELRFIRKYSGKHEAQVIGAIALIQISNANRLQFTSNNSNNTFVFSNSKSQQITNNDSNSTFNSAQLSGFPVRTADETPKSFPPFGCLRLYTRARLVTTSHGIIWYILYICFPSRDIQKIIAFSGNFDLSLRSGVRNRAVDGIPYVPL
ncbi:hypothetical protein AVEN_12975-1 [Araneus ventricosus]|uniref:Uncharacterized protein n=1 Tax=Araneus ventricosus TaxID=182803 RepID=A0A4Y2QIS1_ARAVE|nr:hypothetical protein AVEN_12975-1 [Araneus ventricosus]